MARIVSFLCQFDDPDYLHVALESFKWLPDKLYIIEGSWQSSQGYSNTPLRSNQYVYNIIDRHVDNKRIFLIQANERGEKEQRQIGLEKAKEDGADWCWMLDSDEVYTKPVMVQILNQLNLAPPSTHGFRVQSFNFINSFNTWYRGDYNRIYRVTPEAHFVLNNDVQFYKDGRKTDILTITDRLRYFHYNYVKSDPAQFWRKMHYHETEDPTFKGRVTPQYNAKEHFYTIPGDIPRYTFTGQHPAIMKNHPNIKANIYNDSDLRFSRT
jgi:hypothetical protein